MRKCQTVHTTETLDPRALEARRGRDLTGGLVSLICRTTGRRRTPEECRELDALANEIRDVRHARREAAAAPTERGTVRSVADRDEISALVYRYAELLDGGDLDGVTDMFADATWRSAATGAALTTREEVRAVYDRIILYDGSPRTRHLMDNLIIDVTEGSDDATGAATTPCSKAVSRARRSSRSSPGATSTATTADPTAGASSTASSTST